MLYNRQSVQWVQTNHSFAETFFLCRAAIQTESSSTDSEAHVWLAPWQRSPAAPQTNRPSKIKPQAQQRALTSGLCLFILPELLTDLRLGRARPRRDTTKQRKATSEKLWELPLQTQRRISHGFSTEPSQTSWIKLSLNLTVKRDYIAIIVFTHSK